jgi:hypothetical protein
MKSQKLKFIKYLIYLTWPSTINFDWEMPYTFRISHVFLGPTLCLSAFFYPSQGLSRLGFLHQPSYVQSTRVKNKVLMKNTDKRA